MSDVKGTRRRRAEATRAKILLAAQEEFLERGYHGATITSIAGRAAVAPQTVYFVFHTKAALISAAIDTLVMGQEEPSEPQATSWWAAMRQEPDPREALRLFIRGTAPMLQAAAGLSEILRAAALTDDEVARTHQHHEQLRSAGYREVVQMLAGKGALRDDMSVDTATDILLVTFSDASYLLYTTERGWTHDTTVEWFCGALPALLLAQPN